jgi:hypothetical protein
MTIRTIQVTADDFIKTHASLVHLLRIIQKAGIGGISTQYLCDRAFDSSSQYRLQVIKRAQRDGYIMRVKVDSKGKKMEVIAPGAISNKDRCRVMNMLMPKGPQLLVKLGLA